MNHKIHNVGAAEKIGRYSDAIEAAPKLRWLHTSGTPGVLDNGTFPEGIFTASCQCREFRVVVTFCADSDAPANGCQQAMLRTRLGFLLTCRLATFASSPRCAA
jgi:hypothetical protein